MNEQTGLNGQNIFGNFDILNQGKKLNLQLGKVYIN